MTKPGPTAAHFIKAVSFAFAALMIAASAAAGQDARSCQVQQVVGAAVLSGASGPRVAVAGAEIAAEDRIQTQQDSQVLVVCNDGITLTIGYATSVELGALVNDDATDTNVVVRLFEGIAGFFVPRKTFSGFAVQTRTAIAAVRSTRWLVDTAQGATDVFVREGRVAVEPSADAPVVLGPGDGIDIDADGRAGGVRQWSALRIAEAGDRLGFDWK